MWNIMAKPMNLQIQQTQYLDQSLSTKDSVPRDNVIIKIRFIFRRVPQQYVYSIIADCEPTSPIPASYITRHNTRIKQVGRGLLK